MKYFKKEAKRNSERYIINATTFEKVTERKYPFEQLDKKNEIHQYAICPSCLNPIILIGLSLNTVRNPYGKHAGKSIPDLAEWDQIKYTYCPYATTRKKLPDDDEKLPEITDEIIELYNLLKQQFDRVIYILEKELDIRASADFWANTIKQFLVNRAYLYPWLTEANLPYIFAYFGMTQKRLYMQKIRIKSDLYNTLKKHTSVRFVNSENNFAQIANKDSCFLNLHMRFFKHTYKASEGEQLIESMLFCIDDKDTGNTIFTKQIKFSETYFMNIIASGKEEKRQKWLLDIAEKNMPDLKM